MIKNFKDAVDFLNSQVTSHAPSVLKDAIKKLEILVDKNKVILIAGTNGKGTTGATLQYLLREAGKRVGFFSSPHLKRINERIKVDCEDISDEAFFEVFLKVYEKCKKENFSHFEYLTLMALYYFFEVSNVDYAIFEVGLGGSLDATNAIDHQFSVITQLGLDHEAILGSSLEEIAKNKFGIIGPKNDVFFTPLESENLKKLLFEADANFFEAPPYELKVSLETDLMHKGFQGQDSSLPTSPDSSPKSAYHTVPVKKSYESNAQPCGDCPSLCLSGPDFYVQNKFGCFRMNLPGRRAAQNTTLAQAVFTHLVPDAAKYMSAISKVVWPARMQRVKIFGRDVFLSGDHNPQGIDSLLEILDYYRDRKATVRFVIGICRDKAYKRMIRKLFDFPNSEIYLTETPVRTLHIDEYADTTKNLACYLNADPIKTLKRAIDEARKGDLVVVTGSLYLIANVMLAGEPPLV